jgi:hypothetical protein
VHFSRRSAEKHTLSTPHIALVAHTIKFLAGNDGTDFVEGLTQYLPVGFHRFPKGRDRSAWTKTNK